MSEQLRPKPFWDIIREYRKANPLREQLRKESEAWCKAIGWDQMMERAKPAERGNV